jgi:hypothetical protein
MMTKISTEGLKFALTSVSRLKRRHQMPAAAKLLDCHQSTIRNRLKKKGPKKQYKRRRREITSNEIERVVDVPAICVQFDPEDKVFVALAAHMGDEMPECV